jgi:hypothetical protein
MKSNLLIIFLLNFLQLTAAILLSKNILQDSTGLAEWMPELAGMSCRSISR